MSITIKVSEYEQVGEHIEFIIEVTQKETGESWRFRRRYSHLLEIHRQLKSIDNRVPEFPPKKLFGSKNPKFLMQRKSDLGSYFIEISKLGKIQESSYFKEFIRPKDAKILSASPVAPVQTYKKQKQGPELQNFVNQLNEIVSSKFFDLSSQPAPPESDDVKRQEKAIENLVRNLKLNIKSYSPEGSHINQAYHSTTVVKQRWIRKTFKHINHDFHQQEPQLLLISFK